MADIDDPTHSQLGQTVAIHKFITDKMHRARQGGAAEGVLQGLLPDSSRRSHVTQSWRLYTDFP